MGPGEGIRDILAKTRRKWAFVIRDLWCETVAFAPDASVGEHRALVDLKLSQQEDLSPGLLLPIGQARCDFEEATAAARFPASEWIERFGQHYIGTMWAARYIGTRVEISGTTTGRFMVHLDYEPVEVDWMDWFVMWDFLDNVADNSRDF